MSYRMYFVSELGWPEELSDTLNGLVEHHLAACSTKGDSKFFDDEEETQCWKVVELAELDERDRRFYPYLESDESWAEYRNAHEKLTSHLGRGGELWVSGA